MTERLSDEEIFKHFPILKPFADVLHEMAQKEIICLICGKSKAKNECLCTDEENKDEQF
ncbi:hypothetical protein I2483_17860 [Sporosarcina sp. E16_3]|uniref:hypothetical protein n=1 Tax=Sporosarcina sp. E16_3 TaxID=2789293 RepID=UPI001A910FD3|nr:hypothetical protein [Sporosarcina sp. E16_3]MBO0603535.1 hypothetical protein [Sporosarcina sp. E16_3]